MAKGQKRSTREIRKPKAAKSKTAAVPVSQTQVIALLQKPKSKV